jgi:sugar-specific transcriptional regulator TrmB
MVQDEDVRILKDLGLTAMQAKVYLTLTKTEEATTKTIAKTSKIARQNTYQITAELQKIGLIEKILAKPTKFRAIPLKNAAQMLLQKRAVEYQQVEEETTKLLQTAKDHREKSVLATSNDEFVLIPDKDAHRLRIEQAFRYAQESINTIMILRYNKRLTPKLLPPLLKKAIMRGVRVRHISNKPQGWETPLKNSVWKKNGSYEIKYIDDEPPVMFCIVDEKEVFFSTGIDPNPYNTSALWTNNTGIVTIAKEYFEQTWRKEDKRTKKTAKNMQIA